MPHSPDFDAVVAAAERAGNEVLRWYRREDVRAEQKEDRTPITAADRASHESLRKDLSTLMPEIPMISEESDPEEIRTRHGWGVHWLVDPLDGTKEFLKRTGEFTVNVALIEGGRPVFGVVHAPVLGRTYWGCHGNAFKREAGGDPRSIEARICEPDHPVLVASRDHSGAAVDAFARALGPGVEFATMGSSLKFCLVAEGRADAYLRDGPTMEWDTAAAQCVVEAAGGAVFSVDALGGDSLRYGKEDLRNPAFLCVGDSSFPWLRRLGEALSNDSE